MRLTLEEVARLVGGEVVGDGSTGIEGVSGIREARPGDLTFVSNPRYEKYAADTSASALVVSREHGLPQVPDGTALLVVDDPYDAFARVMGLFAPEGDAVEEGVHASAVVAASASLGESVRVGANAVIEDGARVGEGSTIHAGVFVGRGVTIGREATLYPNVTVRHGCELGDRVMIHSGTVIGSDGFGFALSECEHTKVPQIGNVVIEDDVEIGSNTCIDRGTLGSTRVCKGSKIDNLVQIAHNVVVGEGSVVVAQVGVSGSTKLGRRVVLAGQAGLVGHIEIGDGAVVGAQAGVTRSIPPGERVSGYPARKHSEAKRLYAYTENLPKLRAMVRELESRIVKLEGPLDGGSEPDAGNEEG
jgi:UDP-3-O-[3-hydroxymyristoyl] glucosamine N-acyltransferase